MPTDGVGELKRCAGELLLMVSQYVTTVPAFGVATAAALTDELLLLCAHFAGVHTEGPVAMALVAAEPDVAITALLALCFG